MSRTSTADPREHPAAPDSPDDLTKRSWMYVARKTARELSKDQCIDAAAALTYYSVLALFPAMIALTSLVGLVSDPQKTVDQIIQVMRDMGAGSQADTLEPTITQLAQGRGAGLALIIGLATALWSASGFVGAFGRAMNRIYEIQEGRPFWKLRPLMLVLTLGAVLLSALVLVMLIVSGPLATAIGDTIGLGDTALTIWNIAKWPIIAVIVMMVVALLYYATPNVK